MIRAALLLSTALFCATFVTPMSAQPSIEKKRVGILVYDGVYLLDFAGPMEIFADVVTGDTTHPFSVCTIAPAAKDIHAHTGMALTATYTLSECPPIDILIIPGGDPRLARTDPATAEWIRTTARKADVIMSVCTGAFILADLGLLDDMEATTWFGALERLRVDYPKVRVRKDLRFTDNGRILTTAGVSAGIDGALHIVARVFGRDTAVRTARFVEYNWNN